MTGRNSPKILASEEKATTTHHTENFGVRRVTKWLTRSLYREFLARDNNCSRTEPPVK